MTKCDWCTAEIVAPEEPVTLPVHPSLIDQFGATVTVHPGDCEAGIEEEMYSEWEKLEFGSESEDLVSDE